MAPADENELRQMLYTATTLSQPASVRYPRGCGPGARIEAAMQALPIGKAQVRREGRSGLLILAWGALVDSAVAVGDRFDATVVNMRFVKPLDEDLVLRLAARHRAVLTIEENVVAGGAGSAVSELLAAEGISLPQLHLGIPDRFIEHGSREDSLAAAGLDTPSLLEATDHWWSSLLPGLARTAGG
jgi:1-deoxy-D-xylulose-5-phosphate synthase